MAEDFCVIVGVENQSGPVEVGLTILTHRLVGDLEQVAPPPSSFLGIRGSIRYGCILFKMSGSPEKDQISSESELKCVYTHFLPVSLKSGGSGRRSSEALRRLETPVGEETPPRNRDVTSAANRPLKQICVSRISPRLLLQ